MKHFTYVVVFLLLIQNECLGIQTDIKEEQLIYSYEGNIDVGSNACEKSIARWTIQGNLTVQILNKFTIFQLNDVKTGLFNGNKKDLNYSHLEEIPKDAQVLEQPFVLSKETLGVQFAANEPLWSINFKRGIASHMKISRIWKHQHKSLFGNCEIHTEYQENGLIIETINHETCETYKHKSNVHPAPNSKEYNPIKRSTIIEILQEADTPFKINSTSIISYKPMPNIPYYQHSFQTQEINLLSTSSDFNRINTDLLTVEKKIFYEYENRANQGRKKYEPDTKLLIQQFLDGYYKFEKVFNSTENRKNITEDPIDDMFFALYDIPDEEGIQNLREILDKKGNWDLDSIFVSLLPYMGTDQAVKYIYKIIMEAGTEITQIYAIRLMATFPQYIKEPTNELVQSLEGLLNIENVTNLEAIKTGRILSFASVVARAHELKYLSQENMEKYKTIYYEKFIDSENYDDKMLYLLGLINMADALSYEFKISIITNTSLPANIRSLSLVGFKNTIKTADPEYLFKTFWPVVQNEEENQDVRVESLDLLLSSNLHEKQFNIMLEAFKNSHAQDFVNDQHIANYFITSLESMQNNTAYKEPLSNLATATIEKEHFPIFPRPWTTGNYRLSYSDANLGGYILARTIADPILNSLSTIQLSYNQFAWSLDTGVYSVYIKLQGAVEFLYKTKFLKQFTKDTTLSEVVKLIKDFDSEIITFFQDIHVELVVFIDHKAVFTIFGSQNKENKNLKLKLKYLSKLLEEIISNTFTISYPVMDYTQIPSILGTPINIKNDMQDIFSLYYNNNDLQYRSSWYYQTWLNSYNPILDKTVSSYKYYGNEISINTELSINPQRMEVSWINKKDSMKWVSDKLIGTAVADVELLEKYCSVCDGVTEPPTTLYVYEPQKYWFLNWTYLGIKLNYTQEQFEDPLNPSEGFHSGFKDVHHSNSYAIPYAKPFLVLMHFYRYMYHLKPDIGRINLNTYPLVDNGTQTSIHIELNTNPSEIADPFEDKHKNITIFLKNKVYGQSDESYLSKLKLQYDITSTHNYTDEQGNEKVKFAQNLLIKNDDHESGMQLCSSRVELLPAVRSDKFSILPPEDATAVTVIQLKYKKYETEDWELINCDSNRVITLTEIYSTHDDRNKKIQESADYQKYLEESKGFKFTRPTRSCISAFIASSRYDTYTYDMSLQNISGMTETIYEAFKYDKVENNKLILSLTLDPFVYMIVDQADEFFNYTSYFPYKTRDPMTEVYGDHDIATGFQRSCIITPQKIRSFSGQNITKSKRQNQVAFVECFMEGSAGLFFNNIDDTHVSFKFQSNNNTVEATFLENKLKVTLNGKEVEESYTDDIKNIRIRFLDENVVLLANDKLSIYYNTEYIYIKAISLYYDLICGACSQRCYFC